MPFRCDVGQLAACFSGNRSTIKADVVVSRVALSVVAAHVVAAIVDYYVCKRVAQPTGAIAKFGGAIRFYVWYAYE